MIIVVDHGATKSRWWFSESPAQKPAGFDLPGFNPRYTSESMISSAIKDALSRLPAKPGKMFFYSTGVSDENVRIELQQKIKDYFPNHDVEIHTDLTGAGRGLLGEKNGIVAILGTGSNVGLYENHRISFQPLSLGYMLGDEGGGAYLGKLLLKDYLEGRFPENLAPEFEKWVPASKQETVTLIQSKPEGRQLASYASFAARYNNHPYIIQQIEISFDSFFQYVVSRIKTHEYTSLVAAGAIAWLYADLFKKVAGQYGYLVQRIVKDPMEDLIAYHKKMS